MPSSDLPAGAPGVPDIRRTRAGPIEVLITRLTNGEVAAFATTCPHQETDLEGATLWDDKLRCGRHQYLYDPKTGENLLPARDAKPENLWKLRPGYLPTYAVEERDGWIWVADTPQPPPERFDSSLEVPPAGDSAVDPAPGAVDEDAADSPLEHPPEELRLVAGEGIDLDLPTSTLPGHSWVIDISGPLTATDVGLLPDDPPRHRVHLSATASGQAEVCCKFSRPWDIEPSEIRRYSVVVDPAG